MGRFSSKRRLRSKLDLLHWAKGFGADSLCEESFHGGQGNSMRHSRWQAFLLPLASGHEARPCIVVRQKPPSIVVFRLPIPIPPQLERPVRPVARKLSKDVAIGIWTPGFLRQDPRVVLMELAVILHHATTQKHRLVSPSSTVWTLLFSAWFKR